MNARKIAAIATVALLALVTIARSELLPRSSLHLKTKTTTIPLQRNDLHGVVSAAQKDEQIAEQRNGFRCIIGGALAHLTLGTVYCWGSFMSYAPPSLHYMDGVQRSSGTPDAVYVIPLTLVTQALAMPFGPAVSRIIGNRLTMLLGSWIAATAVYLASYQSRLLPFVAFYSLLFGFGVGIAYTAPMVAAWQWLPNRKGLVSGGILAGFGAGGFLFSLLGSSLVNPDGMERVKGRFPPDVYAGFPRMLRQLSIIYAALSLVGTCLLVEKTPATSMPQKDRSDLSSVSRSPSASPASSWGISLQQALSTPHFWTLWTLIICSATAGLNTASIYKQFAGTSAVLAGDEYQTLVGGLGALCNGLGRLGWGRLSDAWGFRRAFTLLTVMQTVLMLTYPASAQSKIGFAISTCLLFLCLAGNLALVPPVTLRLFGPRGGTVIYGALFSAFAVASIVGGLLTKSIATSWGYPRVFQVMAVLSTLATLLVQRLQPLSSLPQSTL